MCQETIRSRGRDYVAWLLQIAWICQEEDNKKIISFFHDSWTTQKTSSFSIFHGPARLALSQTLWLQQDHKREVWPQNDSKQVASWKIYRAWVIRNRHGKNDTKFQNLLHQWSSNVWCISQIWRTLLEILWSWRNASICTWKI